MIHHPLVGITLFLCHYLLVKNIHFLLYENTMPASSLQSPVIVIFAVILNQLCTFPRNRNKIRTDIERELRCVGQATGEDTVDIDLNTLTLLYIDSHHILTDKLLSIIAYYQDETIHSFPWSKCI